MSAMAGAKRAKPKYSQGLKKAKGLSKLPAAAEQPVPNMRMVAFEAATSVSFVQKFNPRYWSMPSDEELKGPDAINLLELISKILKDIPKWHRKTWRKMLNASFPELGEGTLDQALLKLLVRCWKLRKSAHPHALYEFVEFCAGEGNLTAECLKQRLFGLALDVIYDPDHDMTTPVGLRVMIDSISEAKPGAMNWWGTQCSSFVSMGFNNHNRREDNGFWGNTNFPFVRDGNMKQVPWAVPDERQLILM